MGLNKWRPLPYISGHEYPRKTPQDTLTVRGLPKKGDRILIEMEVLRTGRNTWDTADTVTVEVPGFTGVKVTATWDYMAPNVKN